MIARPAQVLCCEGLRITAGGRTLVENLNLSLGPGQLLAVLGPNGSGKSLTLHTLAGLREPAAGQVSLDGQPLAGIPRGRLSRQLGLLLQDDTESFPSTVLESALLGRHPHRSRWAGPSDQDLAVTRAALAILDLTELSHRDTASLSGGERRRLAVARLLAQQTGVMLLDEPANHLDPRHQVRVLSELAALAAGGRAIAVSLHDPSLALRFALRTLLLFGDGRWRLGDSAQVLSTGALEELFSTPYEDFRSARDSRALLPRAPAA